MVRVVSVVVVMKGAELVMGVDPAERTTTPGLLWMILGLLFFNLYFPEISRRMLKCVHALQC